MRGQVVTGYRKASSWVAVRLTALLAVIFCWALPARSQTSHDLFNDSVLHEIRLTLNPADWSQLKADFRKDTYYKASFSWRNIEVNDIGIRSRGTGSASGEKPYLGLDFSRYVSSQRFLGLSAFRLKNALQDASFVHDRLSMLLFQRMGLPVPRESYAKLFINDQYAGLYIIIEEMDTSFLNRVYGESGGYFFQYSWVREYNFEYLGDDPVNYAPGMFEPKTRKTAYDPATIVAMVKAINQSPDADFVAAVSEYIDLKEWLLYVAVEQYLAEYDGMFGHQGMNNFYVYRPANAKLFHISAWDKEQGFWEPQKSIWERTQTNVLMRRAMQVPALRDYFLDAVRRTALAAGGPGGWLEKELDRAYDLIREAALADPAKVTSNDEFEWTLEVTRQFIQVRRDNVITEAGPLPAPVLRSAAAVGLAEAAGEGMTAGTIISLQGENLAYWELQATELPLPGELNKTVAEVNGLPAPLFSVAPGMVNIQLPWELEGTRTTNIRVVVDGKASNRLEVALSGVSPRLLAAVPASGEAGIATASSDADAGQPGGVMQRGAVMVLYGLGLGAVSNPPASGSRPSMEPPSLSLEIPEVYIGDLPAQVLYAGLAPVWVGVYQINVAVPMDAPADSAVPVQLRIGGTVSNQLMVPVN